MEKTGIVLIGLMVLVACSQTTTENPPAQSLQDVKVEDTEKVENWERGKYVPLPNRAVKALDDGTKYIVHPGNIESGGPPKDGIPSIDNPRYVSLEEADEWIQDNELVLAIEYKGVTRAYPLQILVWHEIVNDEISGDSLLVTYCPLCGSGIAYRREINGESVEFGTSGKLYNSNLVMYDRKTETYWSQIDGIGILGSLTGERLEPVPIDTVVWGEWKGKNHDAEVLSRKTGYVRSYGQDPYGNYYEDSNLFFPVENKDDRIHAKEVVFGVELGGEFKAYRKKNIEEERIISDEVGGIPLKIEAKDSGIFEFTRTDTGEKIAKERDFWFAWYAFHPNTRVYRLE